MVYANSVTKQYRIEIIKEQLLAVSLDTVHHVHKVFCPSIQTVL